MQFLKDHWKTALFAGVVSVLLSEIWSTVGPTLKNADWKGAISLFREADNQAALLGLVVPIALLWMFLRRYRFEYDKPEPLAGLMFRGMALVYLLVFGFHLIFGDIEPLVQDLKRNPYGKVILFVVAAFFLGQDIIRMFKTGSGLNRKVPDAAPSISKGGPRAAPRNKRVIGP